jgi:hypothetical protein
VRPYSIAYSFRRFPEMALNGWREWQVSCRLRVQSVRGGVNGLTNDVNFDAEELPEHSY